MSLACISPTNPDLTIDRPSTAAKAFPAPPTILDIHVDFPGTSLLLLPRCCFPCLSIGSSKPSSSTVDTEDLLDLPAIEPDPLYKRFCSAVFRTSFSDSAMDL